MIIILIKLIFDDFVAFILFKTNFFSLPILPFKYSIQMTFALFLNKFGKKLYFKIHFYCYFFIGETAWDSVLSTCW